MLAGILACFLSPCLCVDGKAESRSLHMYSIHVCENSYSHPPPYAQLFQLSLIFWTASSALTPQIHSSFFPHTHHVRITSNLSLGFM